MSSVQEIYSSRLGDEEWDLSDLSDEKLRRLHKTVSTDAARDHNGQMALKILINSEYGALANPYFRFFKNEMAETITLSGQMAICWIKDRLMEHPLQKKYRWKTIYADTDSVYVQLDWVAGQIAKRNPDPQAITDKLDEFSEKVLQPIIDRGYREMAEYVNAVENRMFMKREKISTKGLWTGKKKYALYVMDNEGVRYPEPKLKVTGIETVRSSTPKLVKKRLERVIELIMTDPKRLDQFIVDAKKEFYVAPIEDISVTSRVRTLEKYETFVRIEDDPVGDDIYEDEDEEGYIGYKKGCPIGVRAAIAYNNYVLENGLLQRHPEILQGEKVKFVHVREPNPFGENVIAFVGPVPDFVDADDVDRYVQFKKTFLKPIRNITDKIGIVVRTRAETSFDDIF
jgi:DNA polymerase elongation subunit (family B)